MEKCAYGRQTIKTVVTGPYENCAMQRTIFVYLDINMYPQVTGLVGIRGSLRIYFFLFGIRDVYGRVSEM